MVREGQSFLWPGATDNKEVGIEKVGEGEPAEGLGSKLGDGRVKLDRRPVGLEDEMHPGGVVETDDLRRELDPVAINRRRSDEARAADAAKDAPITTDPLEWASDPSQHDFPGVDTGPQFQSVEGGNTDRRDRMDDADGIFDVEGFQDSLF